MEHRVSRDTDRAEALRRELVGAIVSQTGLGEIAALPLADALLAHLQREYGGERLYIPATSRQYDMLQLKAALERGDSVSQVCKAFAISRRQLYRLFPNGVPMPNRRSA
jgi:Mor family transcriptional regulator